MQEDFPYVGNLPLHTCAVSVSLQKQLGQFLRKRRGEMTYPTFARKLGISSSSLHRMEMSEQNVTLNTLENLLKRLKCSVGDVFKDSQG
jgi:DNA-binding Xre family transcriptional regulator